MKCLLCQKEMEMSVEEYRSGDVCSYECLTKVDFDNGQSLSHYETGGIVEVTFIIEYPYRIMSEPGRNKTYFQRYYTKDRAKELRTTWDNLLIKPLMSDQDALSLLHRLKNLNCFV